MQIPDTAWSVVDAMHRRFAHTFPATEDGARAWTRMVAEQMRFNDPAGGWCHKASSAGAPPSKDCLARVYNGHFEGWDILTGAGVNGPRVLAAFPPAYYDLTGQFIISVDGRNHLGAVPPSPHEPPTIPDTGGPPQTDPNLPNASELMLLVDAAQGVAAGIEALAAATSKLVDVAERLQSEGIKVSFAIKLGA